MSEAPDRPVPGLRLTLDDGSPVLLRPLRPSDAPILAEGFARLSTDSRILRFFAPVDHLTEAQLHYLTDVDQQNHVAWGALDRSTDAVLGLGVGRFTRLADEPEVAEVALAVVDEAQRHGLGALLFGVLYHAARTRGVTTFRAVVIAHNAGLIERLRALGGVVQQEEGQVTIDLPVVDDLDDLPTTPEAGALKRVLHTIEAALDELG